MPARGMISAMNIATGDCERAGRTALPQRYPFFSSSATVGHRALAAVLLLCCFPLWAQGQAGASGKPIAADLQASESEDSSSVEEVVVFGRNSNLVGQAEAASEGSVSGADLLVRPMLRVAEVLEVRPGWGSGFPLFPASSRR